MTSPQFETPTVDHGSRGLPLQTLDNASDSALSDAWITVRKRLWVIVLLGLLGVGWGWYKAVTQPRLFEAAGTIEIRSGSSNEYRIGNASSTAEGPSKIPTQLAILKSDTLLLNVARDLDLANDPRFLGGTPATRRNIDDPVVRQSVVSSLQGIINVTTLSKTDLIRISCNTLNAQLSADIVNKLVNDYILYSFDSRAVASKRVTGFFSHQLDDLKKQVETSQGEMIDLQKQLGVLGFDPSINQVTANLSDLNKAANTAELARIQAQTRYRALAELDATPKGTGTDRAIAGPAVAGLRSQLEIARANLAQLSANLGPNHPQMLAAKQQVAELTEELHEEQNRVLIDARAAYLTAKAEEDNTKAALATQQDSAFKMRDELVDFTLKQREFNANRTLYENLQERIRTAGVQAGLESTEIDIVDAAVPPISPSLRPKSTIILINTLAMLVLGIVATFVLDSLDMGLRTVSEVEAVSGLPSLALIPRTRRNVQDTGKLSTVQRNLVMLSSPKSQSAEAFRALRTSLLLSIAGGEPQTILLTSATPAEGKTTVSMNLAAVLTQRGVRVLLIDADLRRPTVHHRLGLQGQIGLTSILTGSTTLAEAIQTVPEIPELDILVSGPVPPFPTEMLSSVAMRNLLEEARGTYTHIVMDSPPLLSVTDSIVLARDADAVVLIVRQGKSSKHALRRARDLLIRSGARITGVALNAVDLNAPEYASYYGYYGYSGYGSEGVDSTGWDASTKPSERKE
ncbi:GumC family protein [Granulicella paludicola]|uniref:GumC family protein n=1 Tax=Granulicella paludicola TaxID=474951 RepID=UPI0021E0676F|nr:polysaccharide biosynthesis tyrosine autokinase [Granulicella paludicola]